MKAKLKAKALKILEACPDIAIATVRDDGFPQATTVSFAHDGLAIYIGVGLMSQKAHNMRRDPRVSLTLTPPYKAWNEITGLSMAARAEEVTLAEEAAQVGKLMVKRFPQIAELDMEALGGGTLFRITPTVLSILDYSIAFGHTDNVTVDEFDIAESLESMQHKWLVPA